jgi:endonuclease-3 related protein
MTLDKEYPKTGKDGGSILKIIYNILYDRFGKMNWWPAESDFEVMVGAILTQNTAWTNVEKAIYNLKSRNLLSFEALQAIDLDLLKECIRPSGYYNQKAVKIKEFINFAKKDYNFSIELMKKENTAVMRGRLLDIYGIGEETADSIMLYALKKPVFVIDAYTRRILERHHIIEGAMKEKYKNLQKYFTDNIFDEYDGEINNEINGKKNVEICNEYHALIVMTGKMFCKRIPLCNDCPLKELNHSKIIK